MEELASCCIAESLRLNEDEHHLLQRLSAADNIIQTAWRSAAPDYVRYGRIPADEEPDARERISQARRTLWARHHPARALMESRERLSAIDKSRFHSAIVDYLDRPYLRHPTLDWIFLDMTISSVIAAVGKLLKEGVISRTADETDPRLEMLHLWFGMSGVWRRLEGPIVNPTLVREAMARVAKVGVVWDSFSWSLIDRAIAVDPVAWVIEPSQGPVSYSDRTR